MSFGLCLELERFELLCVKGVIYLPKELLKVVIPAFAGMTENFKWDSSGSKPLK